ncbi:O-acetylhomoserine/O-acetylserine sulfhydrylase-like pyridoxal-dependent enzyme [Bradyrhizobium sp. LM2.3]
MSDRLPGFSTLAVHAGAQPDPTTGARATPIYQTTSFVFNDADHAASLFGLQAFGNIYTRIGNPTNAVLEERVAALEGGTAALAVASGHAAQVVVLQQLLQPGDEFIAARKLYGGSINQFTHAFKSFGWNVVWADPDDIASFERAVTPRTKAIFIESIANPAGSITDIEAVSTVARKAGVPLIVDNTLASPYLIRPIDHGADIVVHSLTKFLGGHGNSIGGIIVDAGTFDWSTGGKYPMLSEPRPEYHGIRLQETFGNFAFAIACRVLGLRDLGPALSPFNAFMILTGIETLPLRMQKHCDNAKAVAEIPRRPSGGGLGELCGACKRQVQPACAQIRAEGRRRRVHLRPEGRLRRRRQPGVEVAAVLASGQCRRHPLARHPSGLDHAQPARRRRQGQVRRRPRRGAALDRHRGQGRSDRRSGTGAGRVAFSVIPGRLGASRKTASVNSH